MIDIYDCLFDIPKAVSLQNYQLFANSTPLMAKTSLVELTNSYAEASAFLFLVSKKNLSESFAHLEAEFNLPAAEIEAGFTAEKGEITVFNSVSSPIRRIFLLGLGDRISLKSFSDVLISFVTTNRTKISGNVLLRRFIDVDWTPETMLSQVVFAIEQGMENLGVLKKEPPKGYKWKDTLFFVTGQEKPALQKSLKKINALSNGCKVTRDLVNTPANMLKPDALAKKVLQLGISYGFEVSVMDAKTLKKMGMNGILAVGQGSSVPPCLIKLEYKGSSSNAGVDAALVGKGITFDTGGISIKSASNMHYMKSDMAGAAAVIGLFCTLSGIKSKKNIVGLLPVAENMADGDAYRPSDIITSYSGFSIEVIDTDAEGRIVLADALTYAAKDIKPEVIVDLATLTGSVITALGYHAAGLFTSNNDLAEQLDLAGQRSGERVWRMPLWDDYAPLLASDMADIKNLGGPAAGSITAAKFLEKFTLNHEKWAHLDIAGTAMQTAGWAKDRIATGYGVKLLATFLSAV